MISAEPAPRDPGFSSDDEDEKTTIESGGWEEEPSTTVEQGDVADKVRALALAQARRPNTAITSTDGEGVSDEPTVDDQRGAAALAMLPPPKAARLVITQGNDLGQAIEVRSGKTYTIGRGIDNDLVLTDMTVSRKHFDLRNDDGAWVLADRGSGNGTLINNRLEDAPFVLATGDVIEIGNTTFQFEQPNGVPRIPRSYATPSDEDSELSTMSGQPADDGEPATPDRLLTPVSRPKTLPPPAPRPRPRPSTNRSPGGYALDRPGPQARPPSIPPIALAGPNAPTLSALPGVPNLPGVPLPGLPLPYPAPSPPPATTLPLPQMANRSPLSPSLLLDPPLKPLPTTIPGQGPMMQPAHPARLPFSYPSSPNMQTGPGGPGGPGGELPKQRSSGISPGIMVVAPGQGRDAPSTAIVPPMSYSNGQPVVVPMQAYGPPPALTRRMKMALSAAAVALLAAIATIAILQGSSGDDLIRSATRPAHSSSVPVAAPASAPGSASPTRSLPKVERIAPVVTPIPPAPPAPPATTPSAPTTTAPPTPASPTAPTPGSPTAPAPAAPTAAPGAAATQLARAAPASVPAPATVRPATPGPAPGPTTAPPAGPSTGTSSTSPAPAPVVLPRTDKPATPATATAPRAPSVTAPAVKPADPPTTPASPTTARPARAAARTESASAPPPPPPRTDRVARTAEKKADKRPERKPERRPAPKNDIRAEIDRIDRSPTESPPPRRSTGRTIQDVKNDASMLYRKRDFSGAAALVSSSASSFIGGDAQELKSIAAIYAQLGKSYNVGMAPGTKPTDAFVALGRAINYDHEVGSAYVSEMQGKLVVVASRAAMLYMAAKDYGAAFQAVRTSDALGSTSPSNKTVREKLDAVAGDLYRAAQGEMAKDPDSAKQKLRQILGMVEAKNPLYGKAARLLNGP